MAERKLCRHTRDGKPCPNKAVRPRGLCEFHYYSPGVRDLYPSKNARATNATRRTIQCVWCGAVERESEAECWDARKAPCGPYRLTERRCLACHWKGWPEYPPYADPPAAA